MATNLMDQLRAIRDAEITRLRQEAGYPTADDHAEPLEMAVIWRYIEKLEATVVAQKMVMEQAASALKPGA